MLFRSLSRLSLPLVRQLVVCCFFTSLSLPCRWVSPLVFSAASPPSVSAGFYAARRACSGCAVLPFCCHRSVGWLSYVRVHSEFFAHE